MLKSKMKIAAMRQLTVANGCFGSTATVSPSPPNVRFYPDCVAKTRLLFAAGADLSIGQLVAFSAETV